MAEKKDHYWIKSAFLTTLQSFSGTLLGFGSFYFLIRLLTKYEFGAWTLFTATTTIVEFIRNGVVQSALIKFLAAADDGEKPKILSASCAISGIITVVFMLLSFCVAGTLSHLWKLPELVAMLLIYNIVFVFSGLLTQFQSVEQAGFKFSGIFVSTLIRQGGLFAYILAAHILKFKLELIHLVYVMAISAFVSAFVSYAYVYKQFKVALSWQREWIMKLYHYGKYAFGTTLSAMLSNSLDQMMLGGMLSAASAGAYNVAVRITNLVEIPTSSVATIVFPKSSKLMESHGNDAVKYLYERSVGAILAILVPGLIFLFVFAGYVVEIIAGQTYAETIPILRITVLYCLLIPYGRQFGTILNSINKPRITFVIVVITGVINAVLNYFLIRSMGVIGAAWATLASNVIGFGLGQMVLKRELNISMTAPWRYAVLLYPELYQRYVKPMLKR